MQTRSGQSLAFQTVAEEWHIFKGAHMPSTTILLYVATINCGLHLVTLISKLWIMKALKLSGIAIFIELT